MKIITFLAIFIFCLKGLAGEDIYFHLATGRYVFDHKTIPIRDIFSFTAYGKPWVNQNWLADTIFYIIMRSFGNLGEVLFFSLLFFSIFLTLYLILRKITGEKTSLLLVFLASLVAVSRFQARPEPGSYLLLLLVLYSLLSIKTWRLIFSLPLIFLFWANWQAGFVAFGFYIVGVFLIRDLWISFSRPDSRNLGRLIPEIISSILSLAAVFLNPTGIKGLTYFLEVQPKYLVSDFTEWGSLVRVLRDNRFSSLILEDKFLIIGYLIALVLFIGIVILWLKTYDFKFKKLTHEDIFMFVLGTPFIFLPFFANRFGAIAVIFMAILVAYFWKSDLSTAEVANEIFSGTKPARSRLSRDSFLKNLLAPRSRFLTIATLGTCSILFFARIVAVPPKLEASGKSNPFRDEALAFLDKNKITGNIFNPLEDGGYLIWKEPQRQVFMDGRLDVYTASKVYEDYKIIYDQKPNDKWKEAVHKYKLEIIMLPGWQKEPMATIRKSGLYNLVYWSDYFFILVKNDGQNKNYTESNSLKYIEPFKSEDYNKKELNDVIGEYEKLSKISPISANIATSLASAYQEKGAYDQAIAEYEKSVVLKPDDGMVRLALGSLHLVQAKKKDEESPGHCEKAREHFEAALRRTSAIRALAFRNLGFVSEQCFGDYPTALSYFTKFINEAKNTSFAKDQSLMNETNQKIWELQTRIQRGY